MKGRKLAAGVLVGALGLVVGACGGPADEAARKGPVADRKSTNNNGDADTADGRTPEGGGPDASSENGRLGDREQGSTTAGSVILFTLQARKGTGTGPSDMAHVVEVLTTHFANRGVEVSAAVHSGDSVWIEVPSDQASQRERIEDLLATSGSLQIRRVNEIVAPGDSAYDATGPDCDEDREGRPPDDAEVTLCNDRGHGQIGSTGEEDASRTGPNKFVVGPTLIDARSVVKVEVPSNDGGQAAVAMTLDEEGAESFGDLTADAACAPRGSVEGRLAIVGGAKVRSSPAIGAQTECGEGIESETVRISVGDHHEAEALATTLRWYALPMELELVSTAESVGS